MTEHQKLPSTSNPNGAQREPQALVSPDLGVRTRFWDMGALEVSSLSDGWPLCCTCAV